MKGKTGFRTGIINGLTGVIGLPEGRARWSLSLLFRSYGFFRLCGQS
jgi:hypothetical protein